MQSIILSVNLNTLVFLNTVCVKKEVRKNREKKNNSRFTDAEFISAMKPKAGMSRYVVDK